MLGSLFLPYPVTGKNPIMRKRFNLKIYGVDGAYIKTLNPNILMNDVTFTDKIGGGQGQCVLDLKLSVSDFGEGLSIDHMNIVKIYESDDENSETPRVIYTGFISQYAPYFKAGAEGVRVTLLGLVSMLTFDYFKSGASYDFTINKDPAEAIKDIVDDFQSRVPYAWITRAAGQIDTVGTTIDYDVSSEKWIDTVKKMAAFSDEDWWWHVDQDGEMYLKDRPATATHILTVGKDVEYADIPKNNEKIVNRYRLTWGSSPVTTTIYEDATSQSAYLIRGKNEIDANINDSATADQKGNKIIADGKDPKVEAKATVNTNYDIESIKPGHTVTIRNVGGSVMPSNMLITAIKYTPSSVELTLENPSPSLADTFSVAVQSIA